MFGTGPLFYYMEQGKKNCAPNGYAKADRPLLIVGTALGAVRFRVWILDVRCETWGW